MNSRYVYLAKPMRVVRPFAHQQWSKPQHGAFYRQRG